MVVRAAASQFNQEAVEIRLAPYVNDPGEIPEIVEEACNFNSLIAYTLVIPGLREKLVIEAKKHGIPALDLMTPMIEAIASVIEQSPKWEPGLVRKTDEEYFRKVDAIEFAVKCDDGKDARGITMADLVIIGVSRTSKTPLCMYLAHKRIKAANLPLVPEVSPPEEIFRLPHHKLIGLRIHPQQLMEIRRERLKTLGITANAGYISMERINEELSYAEDIMNRTGCAVIDITNKAVEETANKVLEIYFKGARPGL
ncbi:pyruvate, water dikinase regulatory protein [Pelotomaculum sp. PtaB.Bin117]|uniref:pyruvate, water dikinase regulatory protein n=1 Tax=Pelotomaculum sp. PtaB.Bin117 TaxID=1811694 RepID=UPI0009C75C8E|nr:pyruvate, water dikinase regulatory protein [Pelotomaculum sp. PtaB.Bin117]OPX87083.1 MAG: putative pyruvate, phosphate dikinase regulatory protein [Pelotomaculum sp. PtaB.Bin117]